jgi:hypothetical protein
MKIFVRYLLPEREEQLECSLGFCRRQVVLYGHKLRMRYLFSAIISTVSTLPVSPFAPCQGGAKWSSFVDVVTRPRGGERRVQSADEAVGRDMPPKQSGGAPERR